MNSIIDSEKPSEITKWISSSLDEFIPETDQDIEKIKNALNAILYPNDKHDPIEPILKDRVTKLRSYIILCERDEYCMLIPSLFRNKFEALDKQFPLATLGQYIDMICDHLKVFSPKTKDEVRLAISALESLLLFQDKVFQEAHLKDMVKHFKDVYDLELWGIPDKRKEAYLKLVSEVVQDRIKVLEKMIFPINNSLLETQGIKREEKSKHLQAAKKFKWTGDFYPEDMLSKSDKNIRRLVGIGIIPDDDLSSRRFDYSEEDLTVFENDELVESMLAGVLCFDDAVAIHRLTGSTDSYT